jgi:hypothetical protein
MAVVALLLLSAPTPPDAAATSGIVRYANSSETCSCGASASNWERCLSRVDALPAVGGQPRRFIQVGAHMGGADQNDLSRKTGLGGIRAWAGLLIEADPTTFPRLVASMCADRASQHVCLNRAICTRGAEATPVPFYALDASVDRETLVDARSGLTLPSWAAQVASFNRSAVLAHESVMRKAMLAAAGPDAALRARVAERFSLADLIETHVVPCQTLEGALADAAAPRAAHAGSGVGGVSDLRPWARAELLIVDTEGFDAEVLLSLSLRAFRPRFVVFEHVHLSWQRLVDAARHLRRHGYSFARTVAELRADVLPQVAPAAARKPAQLIKAVWSQLKWMRRESKATNRLFNCVPFLADAENVFAARPAEGDETDVTVSGCAHECPDRSIASLREDAKRILDAAYGRAYAVDGTLARRPTWRR